MRNRTWRAWLVGLALLLGGSGTAAPPARAAAAAGLRVGLVVDPEAPDGESIAAGFRAAARGARVLGVELVTFERSPGADEAETRAVLGEMAIEGAAAIVVVGDRAARTAASAVRDRPVIAVTPTPLEDAPSRVRRVAWTADPARLAEELRRLAPGARRVAVAGPGSGTGDAIVAALSARGAAHDLSRPQVDRLVRREATGGYEPDLSAADVVFAAPETSAADVTDLARRLSGQGISLVGAAGAHLDAGAAIVLRPLPSDVGALAAAAAAEALAGSSEARPVVRPRRVVREVHLANARRLGFTIPLAVLAASDRTVAPPPERR